MPRFGRLARLDPNRASRPMSDINMTPLIDVMLVLVVIFIVTAPLLASRLKLELPAAEGATRGDAPAVLQLAIGADGQVRLGDETLPPEQLRERLQSAARAALARHPEAELQLRADQAVPYGRVAELIGWAQAAGLLRVGLVATEAAAPKAEAAPR
jgi:biopolymer transport protein TolR